MAASAVPTCAVSECQAPADATFTPPAPYSALMCSYHAALDHTAMYAMYKAHDEQLKQRIKCAEAVRVAHELQALLAQTLNASPGIAPFWNALVRAEGKSPLSFGTIVPCTYIDCKQSARIIICLSDPPVSTGTCVEHCAIAIQFLYIVSCMPRNVPSEDYRHPPLQGLRTQIIQFLMYTDPSILDPHSDLANAILASDLVAIKRAILRIYADATMTKYQRELAKLNSPM